MTGNTVILHKALHTSEGESDCWGELDLPSFVAFPAPREELTETLIEVGCRSKALVNPLKWWLRED